MKKVLLVLLFVASSASAGDDGWQLVSTDDGITTWEKEVPGSNIFAFRGEKVMNIPISKVADVIVNDDTEQKLRWVDRLADIKIINYTRSLTTTYHDYAMPFPVSNRDLVWEFRKVIDKLAKTVTVTGDSIDLPEYPPEQSVGVRAVCHGKYVLKMIDAQHTDVLVQAFADAKGWVPQFAVNIINRAWPRNTLIGLEKEASRPETGTDQDTLEQIEKPNAAAPLSH